ncbi:kelch-like protein 24 [Brienomyrus brachyistius]|uniref:kelch-like protein 24 n=1 Tax=Brienomyrus brachyistius TaxID=42636 RepID=UPI0020B309E2|nr:kelch-like protein 24 [Brienomyrus brachyistius]
MRFKKTETQMEGQTVANFSPESCFATEILQVLSTYRKSGIFTDVVLQVEDQEFPCHRALLCASSNYFRSMFQGQLRESCQSLIKLQGISAAAMENLLNFMYEGKVDVDEENVEIVFRAADLLGVNVLSKACIQFLEQRVDHSNCLGIMDFASSFFIQPLAEQCQKILYQDFVEVYKHEEFLSLTKGRLTEFLSCEQLKVDREEVLVEAILKWVRHDPNERKEALKDLLECVHLPLVDPVFLIKTLESDKILQDSKECLPLLLEAMRYHIFGKEVNSSRTQPRRSTVRMEVIVVIGGCDRNGLSRLSYTQKFNIHSKEWLPATSIPGYSKSEFAACELQNDVYVSGGQLNSTDTWRYLPQLDQWVRVACLANGRWRHKMTALQGKLYAVGGFNGHQRLSSVECYSAYDNQWQEVAPLLLPVSSAALVACSGKLYIIGGALSENCNTDKVQCYDPVNDQWSYMAPSPFTQRCISATTFDDNIYVVGGLLDDIYKYTPSLDTWSKVASLSMKLESCGLTVAGGKIYILGGRNESGFGIDKMWTFNPESRQLTEELPMSRCVSYHGCVTVTQHFPLKPHV